MPRSFEPTLHRAVKHISHAQPDQFVVIRGNEFQATPKPLAAKVVQADRDFVKRTLARLFTAQLEKYTHWEGVLVGPGKAQVDGFIDRTIASICPEGQQLNVKALRSMDNVARNMARDSGLAAAVQGNGMDPGEQFAVKFANADYHATPPPKLSRSVTPPPAPRRCCALPAMPSRTQAAMTTIVAVVGGSAGGLATGAIGGLATAFMTGDVEAGWEAAVRFAPYGAAATALCAAYFTSDPMSLARTTLSGAPLSKDQEAELWKDIPVPKLLSADELRTALRGLFRDGLLPARTGLGFGQDAQSRAVLHFMYSISATDECSAVTVDEVSRAIASLPEGIFPFKWQTIASLLTSVKPGVLWRLHLAPDTLPLLANGAECQLGETIGLRLAYMKDLWRLGLDAAEQLARNVQSMHAGPMKDAAVRWTTALVILNINSARLDRFLLNGAQALSPESNGRAISELIEEFERAELPAIPHLYSEVLDGPAATPALDHRGAQAQGDSKDLIRADNPQPDAARRFAQAQKAERRTQAGRATQRREREPQSAVIHVARPPSDTTGHQQGQQAWHEFLGTVHHDRSRLKRLSDRERALYNPMYDCGMAIARRQVQDRTNAGGPGDGVRIHRDGRLALS